MRCNSENTHTDHYDSRLADLLDTHPDPERRVERLPDLAGDVET